MKGALFFEQDKNIDAAMINFKNTRFVEFCLFYQNIWSLQPDIFIVWIFLLLFLFEWVIKVSFNDFE
jgi:hypothetical protein